MHSMHEIQRKVATKERLIAFFVILSVPVVLSHQKNKKVSKKHEEKKTVGNCRCKKLIFGFWVFEIK